jgi:hypothetical protein
LCRSDVSGIDDHLITPDLILRNTNFDSSTVTLENDIWLDSYVWEDHTDAQPRLSAVHSFDVETLIASYTSDCSDTEVTHHAHPPSTSNERRIWNEDIYDSSSVSYAQHDRSSLDLKSIGSHFKDLEYHTKQWMDEYLHSRTLQYEGWN